MVGEGDGHPQRITERSNVMRNYPTGHVWTPAPPMPTHPQVPHTGSHR